LTKTDPPDPGPDSDPFHIRGVYDDAWEYTVRFVPTADGLKVWSLTIAPQGLPPDGPRPEDVPGTGINTRILRAVRFPYIRQLMKEQAEAYLARVLEERDGATPEDRPIADKELARARLESAGAQPPTVRSAGRPPTPDDVNAQLALDVLDHKDQHGYRKDLREMWSNREGHELKVKAIDTRMRRLRDDRWLTGYGKLATIGPQLKTWLEANPDSLRHQAKE
jgi:hypothetical protein